MVETLVAARGVRGLCGVLDAVVNRMFRVHDILDQKGSACPERVFLRGSQHVTYGALGLLSRRVAAWCLDQGIGPR